MRNISTYEIYAKFNLLPSVQNRNLHVSLDVSLNTISIEYDKNSILYDKCSMTMDWKYKNGMKIIESRKEYSE